MLSFLKKVVPHAVALVTGVATFKVLDEIGVSEKGLIVGTGLAAGVVDTAVSVGLGILEKKASRDSYVENITEASVDDFSGYNSPEFYEPDEDGVDAEDGIPKEATEDLVDEVSSNVEPIKEVCYEPDEEHSTEGNSISTNESEEELADGVPDETECGDIHLNESVEETQEEPTEEIVNEVEPNNEYPSGVLSDDSIEEPSDEEEDGFAETFVDAADKGDEAIEALLDSIEDEDPTTDKDSFEENTESNPIIYYADWQEPHKGKSNTRRKNHGKKKNYDKQTRLERRWK